MAPTPQATSISRSFCGQGLFVSSPLLLPLSPAVSLSQTPAPPLPAAPLPRADRGHWRKGLGGWKEGEVIWLESQISGCQTLYLQQQAAVSSLPLPGPQLSPCTTQPLPSWTGLTHPPQGFYPEACPLKENPYRKAGFSQ